jgi:hypothetical protein
VWIRKKTTSLNTIDLDDIDVPQNAIPDFHAIPTLVNDKEILALKDKVFSKTATAIELLSYIKHEFCELGFTDATVFPMMFDKVSRGKLQNFNRERTKTPSELLTLQRDFVGFIQPEAVKLDIINNICQALGLSHSTDQEATFSAKAIMDQIGILNERITQLETVQQNDRIRATQRKKDKSQTQQQPYVETKNRISKALESWSGSIVVSAPTKRKGKCSQNH